MTTTTSSGWVTRKSWISLSPSASGVAPSSQTVWQRYIPRTPSPRNPARLADAVLVLEVGDRGLVRELGAHAPVGQPVRVVRIDQQAADAVGELRADAGILL